MLGNPAIPTINIVCTFSNLKKNLKRVLEAKILPYLKPVQSLEFMIIHICLVSSRWLAHMNPLFLSVMFYVPLGMFIPVGTEKRSIYESHLIHLPHLLKIAVFGRQICSHQKCLRFIEFFFNWTGVYPAPETLKWNHRVLSKVPETFTSKQILDFHLPNRLVRQLHACVDIYENILYSIPLHQSKQSDAATYFVGLQL